MGLETAVQTGFNILNSLDRILSEMAAVNKLEFSTRFSNSLNQVARVIYYRVLFIEHATVLNFYLLTSAYTAYPISLNQLFIYVGNQGPNGSSQPASYTCFQKG